MDFQKVKLGTIADITTGKSNVVDSLKDGLYPFYDRSDLVKRSNRYLYDVESAIIMPGESSTFLPKMAYGKFDLHQRAYAIFPHNGIYPEYLYYYILYAHDYFKIVSTGSTVASLRLGMFLDMPIQLPSFDNQQKIASVLSALDKKIALNRQINQNLEALARQLYDYWFVQFDFPDANGKPYKSSGGKMVYNPILKREIPEGWEMKKLGELCYFSNGINYDKTIEGDTNYKIVNVRNISSSSMLIDSEDLDSICLPSKQAKNYLIEKNAILIARSGVPGATRIVEDVLDCIYCGFIIKCLPHNQLLRLYLTFLLKQFEGTTLTQTGGSILKNVSQETLKSICIVVPSEEILKTFDTQIQTIIDTMNLQINQIASLTKQRDELLPLLMNGQVNFDLSDD